MYELIKLELKKLCRKRLTILVTSGCFLATAFFFFLPFLQFKAWDETGSELFGAKALSYRQSCFEKLSGVLTDTRIEKDIKEYQTIYNTPGNLIAERGGEVSFTDEIFYGYLIPRHSYLNMLGNTYLHNHMGHLNIPAISPEEAKNFYQTRNKNVDLFIKTNPSLSDAEKKYWKNKNAAITEPYEYGYPLGWSTFGDTAQMLILCILGICIAAAPTFSNEYQSGTDALILSTRYGKNKLIHAKIISSLLFGTVVYAINAATALSLPLITFGSQGGNLPLQIMDSYCPYPLTFSQATMILLGTGYLIMLGLLSITLLCSSRLSSSFTVLLIDVILILLPVFLSPGTNNLWRHIYSLLPCQTNSGLAEFKEYLSYQFGPLILTRFEATALLYLALTLLTLPLAHRSFKKHQVQ